MKVAKGNTLMAVMDEFREERAMIKNGTAKQKYQYFKDYYRTPLILTLILAALLGAFLYHYFTANDIGFYAALLNASSYGENEAFEGHFCEAAGIDRKKYDVYFDSGFFYMLDSSDEDTYITGQKLAAYGGSATLDVMLGSGNEFAAFANSTLFWDLRQVLNEEQLAKYGANLYYIDAVRINDVYEAASTEEILSSLPDPKHPERMQEPIPVAIYVDSNQELNENYYFRNSENGIALGIYSNSTHVDYAVKLIEYLLQETH